MHTNIDGSISGMFKVRDYILENGLNVVWITETKLNKDFQINFKKWISCLEETEGESRRRSIDNGS